MTDHGALALGRMTLVMGILNVTPDSFSDGGRYLDIAAAVRHGLDMAAEGADLIDVGGESTRPGATDAPPPEQLRRIEPVIRALRASNLAIPISVDTRSATVAAAALDAGADIINDVSAGTRDPAMLDLAARRAVPIILMHMRGDPATMQNDPRYGDVVAEVRAELALRLSDAVAAGVVPERILLDPGIGFGKTPEQSMTALARLPELHGFGCRLLVGASRKRFIASVVPSEPAERIGGSLAAHLIAARNGAAIVRVHDVAETVQALRVAAAIESRK